MQQFQKMERRNNFIDSNDLKYVPVKCFYLGNVGRICFRSHTRNGWNRWNGWNERLMRIHKTRISIRNNSWKRWEQKNKRESIIDIIVCITVTSVVTIVTVAVAAVAAIAVCVCETVSALCFDVSFIPLIQQMIFVFHLFCSKFSIVCRSFRRFLYRLWPPPHIEREVSTVSTLTEIFALVEYSLRHFHHSHWNYAIN